MNGIKEKRQAIGITQAALAAEMQIDRTTIAKWENNESFPRADKLPVLAKILHCTIEDLYNKGGAQSGLYGIAEQ